MRNGLDVDEFGDQYWYKDDQLHREDGPAVEYAGGTTRWYYKHIFVGRGDRPDPALWERVTSTEINGGPLLNGYIVDTDKIKHWYKDDKKHREDGPAVEYPEGEMDWYLHGEHLGPDAKGFWKLWDKLTEEQRGNPTLLRYMPH